MRVTAVWTERRVTDELDHAADNLLTKLGLQRSSTIMVMCLCPCNYITIVQFISLSCVAISVLQVLS